MPAINEIVVFEEALEIAILTPLSKAFECRRYLAKFSFNPQLYRYIRESHSIGIASLTIYSTFKNLARLYLTYQATQWTANRATIRLVTLSPIYRTISPSLLAYKAYLIV